ncbi:hypothetical protein GCM10027569_65530 [Flindersiella endophytica]
MQAAPQPDPRLKAPRILRMTPCPYLLSAGSRRLDARVLLVVVVALALIRPIELTDQLVSQ